MREYYASSLHEFYDSLDAIVQTELNKYEVKDRIPLLWFRGLTENTHTLLPTLYRGNIFDDNNNIIYNQLKLKEDSRYQHFKSRTYHLIKTNPNLESEWSEIYQHHLGKTRLMDWTESAKIALSFAVEAFLDTQDSDDLNKKRQTMTPTVTVINPTELNSVVYQYFCDHQEYIERALKEFYPNRVSCKKVSKGIIMSMKGSNKNRFFACIKDDLEMRGIVSLCVLEDMRDMAGDQLRRRIITTEFNPFYYLILRYYTDALPVYIEKETDFVLPPLAVLHPYHSDRIRRQRGTFSVFPNYVFNKEMRELYETRNIDVRIMERQKLVNPLLSRIYITDPQKVARELLYAGDRRTEIYPGLDDYARYLETVKFFV